MKQKLQFSVLFLFFIFLSNAQTFDIGNLRYTVTNGLNVNVAQIGASSGVENIPSSVVNSGVTYNVTSIKDYGFYYSNATSVNIPNSITHIGVAAFRYSSLTSINIPSSVTSFGFVALECFNLTSVTVNWTTPLTVGSDLFSSTNIPTIPLYVPAGTEALYEGAAVWTNFNSINAILSSEDFNQSKISVYPNPSNGIFNIENEGSTTIEIFDILGNQITTQKANVGDTMVDLNGFTAGIYFAKITTENNQTQTVKLIKQ